MKTKRRLTLMAALRAEMAHFATLCVMVLAIPLLQPVAQARAVQNGLDFTICTQDGLVSDPESRAPGTMPEDCPCVITCNACTVGKFVKAFQSESPVEFARRKLGEGWWLAGPAAIAGDDAPAGANGIRGPPLSV
ncbi:MAG: hypothetical protein GY789_20785 [Hyphomicrobiales bacterium]|nr:hypothetical protein [Hyphomicrobiales bacterium]MCP4999116.1 hypothetical protein [Hyphomicrobiales bacterium]